VIFYNKYVTTHIINRKELPTVEVLKARARKWRLLYGEYLPIIREAKILDAGCGHGVLLWWLQNEKYEAAEGVDISSEQVELGMSLGIKNIHLGSLQQFLENKENYYHVIFMRDVLEHIPKTEVHSVLEICKRSLVQGGRLVIQVPNADSPFAGRIRYGDFTHEAAYNRSSLTQIFGAIGFGVVDFKPATIVKFGFGSILKWFSWKIVSGLYQWALRAELGPGNYIVSQNIIAVAEKK
jgi:2-polyprenyl-3-methyl-5-hydroxy-6-metoxy-1,4-benzoquinol methylase